MNDTKESVAQQGLKLVEKGAVQADVLSKFGIFFKPESPVPQKEPLGMAFCAAAALDYALLDENSFGYKIIDDYKGRSMRDALQAVSGKVSASDIFETLAGISNAAEDKKVFGRAVLKYFFAARMLKPNSLTEYNELTLQRQLEQFVFRGDRVTFNLRIGEINAETAKTEILEFVAKVREIHKSLTEKSAGEIK